ncbi:ribonuclease P protein component [Sandaracinobacter sp. RS1-74]|uniref:ribonuclease P protein component n=1 Tax=Sandaracinobacteroides sayramensis TaxID=2913411 RepID=UPI001EDBB605|nr:ribonuclease P protein component [Sandaracinobacteroides sayramensis]MCG2839886.1 ribonuclease P protein component [Sandaracinobacteroides sayramensis]
MADESFTAGPVPAVLVPAAPPGAPSAAPARIAISRITRRRDFLAANGGIRVPLPPFVLLVKPTGLGVSRAGFTVSKKIGNSVARNRARRRLREVARLSMPELAVPSADHVFIARSLPEEMPFEQLLAFARKALTKARAKLEAAA